jgi:hypothetical protein
VRHDPDVPGLLEAELAWHEQRGLGGWCVGCKEMATAVEGTKNGPLGPACDTTVVMSNGPRRYVVEVSILPKLPR